MFRSVPFERELSLADFLALPKDIELALLSMGVHFLLPFGLKQLGFACANCEHQLHAEALYSFELECAWSLGNAFMNEVSVHACAFVPLLEVLALLGQVSPELPAEL